MVSSEMPPRRQNTNIQLPNGALQTTFQVQVQPQPESRRTRQQRAPETEIENDRTAAVDGKHKFIHPLVSF